MGKIIAICTSDIKGIQKSGVEKATFVVEHGIQNDAHAGPWHRQVSLLSHEAIEDFRSKGAEVSDGAFGENIVVSGIVLHELPVGTKLRANNVLFEVTQIGKECHQHCQIFHKMGDCIMPRLGIFARVIEGGEIGKDDEITIEA